MMYAGIKAENLQSELPEFFNPNAQGMSVNGETEDFEEFESEGIPEGSMEKVNSENQKLRVELERISEELNAGKRELEIEAGLEKVRATAMAMHKSEHLRAVVQILYDQLRELGFQSGVASITIMDPDTGDIDWWMEGFDDGYNLPERYHVPFFEHSGHLQQLAHWKSGTSYAEIEISGQEKKTYDTYYFFQTDFSHAPESSKQLMMQQESVRFSMAYMKYGALSWSPSSLSKDQTRVLERFAKVFEQCYTRFLDLQKAEAQAREAQIEVALERVRAKAMAMHKSDELTDVASLLFRQIRGLGITAWTTGFNIWSEDNSSYVDYVTDPEGNFIEPYTVDTTVAPVLIAVSNAKKAGLEFLLNYEEGEAIKETYRVLMSFGEKGQYEKLLESGFQFPTQQYNHFVFGSKVSLLFITYEPIPEAHDIFKRFGKVFEQTYTRFLDLQKAEEQARESQIEAALERVRASSLAMHKSVELRSIVKLVFEKLQELNFGIDGAAFIIIPSEDSKSFIFWIGDRYAEYPNSFRLDYYDYPSIKDMWDAKASGKEYFSKTYWFEEKNQWFRYAFENTDLKSLSEDLKQRILNQECLTQPISWAKNTGIGIHFHHQRTISDNEIDILKRFSKVFDQAYIRFLDLEKAEAQAREAEIEVALEKVRSRSLAMHKSDDLKDVVFSVFERLSELQIQTDSTAIIVYFDESMKMELWTANEMNYPTKFTLPMTGRFYPIEGLEARKEQKVFLQHLPFEEKNRYWKELFNTIEFQNVPEARKNFLLEKTDCLIELIAFGRVTGIMLFRYFNTPFNDEEIEITERFAKVFDQAYTRFLDLQKAEKQAREAQIEAALEKVRSRTMAMQNSEELADAAYVLFEQLNILGVTHERINIGIVDEKNKCIDFWVTEQGGQKLQTKFSGRISEPTTLSKSFQAWKKGAKSLVVDLQGEELQSWLKYLEEEIKIPFNKAYLHSRRVQTAGFFSKGMLVVTSPEPLQDEALYLLEKFANVFDLTYTRFNDLVLAEAQAIKAKENLKAIQAAKSKAEKALVELSAAQEQLIQQEKLASLGQLTAGIAHEIKNPLNFVNNFSEVSLELIDEAQEERSKGQESRDENSVDEILEDIKSNLTKIHEHGIRANNIVSSMLQHSRGGSGKREPTDLNALIKEYVNLSFHGMRAGKNPIDVEIALDLDPEIKEAPLIKEDFSRVLINLCNNSFDAMRGKVNSKNLDGLNNYQPKLIVRTKTKNNHILIEVEDNGPGIPDEIKDKILQPFFTTKKGTEGTGLGLSITHDIIKAHGGELKVESKEGQYSQFIIGLPL